MQLEELRVLDAAAQIQAAVRHVPVPILLAYQRAQELQEGDAGDQELAQAEQIDATVLAQLAAGLASPPPRSSFPVAEDESNVGAITNREDYIVGCIEKLQFEITSQATGYLVNKDPQVPASDREEMIRSAIVKTCTRARDLRRDVKPLFWNLLKKNRVDRFRAVQVLERNAPRLTDTCADQPSSEQDLTGQHQCDLAEQAMGTLTPEERQVLDLRYGEGLPYEQVGQRLNIDKEAARKRVNRALQQVRAFYKKLLDQQSQRLPARGLFWRDLWAMLRHLNTARLNAKCPDLRELQEI
jgi:RNA polymerase sigma factor (sigma-70 family)